MAVLSAIAVLAYGQAKGMTWQFDDYINLRLLAGVSTREGLVDFLFDASAGPLGRPLSLLTFIANYADWQENPWGVSRLTLVLHVLNAWLLWCLVRRLYMLAWSDGERAAWLAALTAGLWLILPIHASGILMPIQRMTHVSAFFMLTTLFGYAVLRQGMGRQPNLAQMLGLSAWVLVGALLAAFSKENGVVVITLVALLEVFFFTVRGERRTGLWTAWLVCAFLAVPIMMLYQLHKAWPTIHDQFLLYRGYSMPDHLATQWVISWEYVRQIMVPRPALMGPYHDGHVIFSWTTWQPYTAIAAWVLMIALALFLRRDAQPQLRQVGITLLFAVLWFAACHQVESTFIPLELYFEHRNYVAAIGFCIFATTILNALWLTGKSKIIPVAVVATFFLYQALSLQQITSLWGQPVLANEMWHINNPRSTRALQAFSNDLIAFDFHGNAVQHADAFVRENRKIDVAIQFFPAACLIETADMQQIRFQRLYGLIDNIRQPAGVATGLAKFGDAVRSGQCAGVTVSEYADFLQHLLRNDRIDFSRRVRHHVNYEMALTQLKLDDIDAYASFGKQAFMDFPSVSLAQAIAIKLFESGRLDEAVSWINQAIDAAPLGALHDSWSKQLSSLRQALEDVRKHIN